MLVPTALVMRRSWGVQAGRPGPCRFGAGDAPAGSIGSDGGGPAGSRVNLENRIGMDS
jgi:hypothetical protein